MLASTMLLVTALKTMKTTPDTQCDIVAANCNLNSIRAVMVNIAELLEIPLALVERDFERSLQS